MLLAMSPVSAFAQYGYGYLRGYGGYGWGGWGSTLGSTMARGLGSFNMCRGMYNIDTAAAGSINTNTVMRWNQYLSKAAATGRASYAAHGRARRKAIDKAQKQFHDQLRHHPEIFDITDGDALNVLLDELLNPAIAGSSLRMIKTPLKPDLIQDIPFEYASEGMTVCLDQMTMDGQLPLALRVEAFQPERDAVRKAAEGAGGNVIGDVENLGGELIGGLKSAAVDLFKDMDWKHLTGSDKPSQP